MKKIVPLFLPFFLMVSIVAKIPELVMGELPFVVVIYSHNNSIWVRKNLDSVRNQDYSNFRVIYIDDCSKDGTARLVEYYIQKYNLSDKVFLIKNPKRYRKMVNYYTAFHSCYDNEIIVQLDGDDWFAHDKVLANLNNLYYASDIWITYGQFKCFPNNKPGYCRPIPYDIMLTGNFREWDWVFMPTRSFYAWLYKLIKIEDLISQKVPEGLGRFFIVDDYAMIYPIIEMARMRTQFISQISYIYNLANPIKSFKRNNTVQLKNIDEILKAPRYVKLDEPIIGRLEKLIDAKADVVVISHDPSDLSTFIKSLHDKMHNIGRVYALFEANNDNIIQYYNLLDEDILNIECIGVQPGTVKYTFTTIISQSESEYIILCNDDEEIFREQDINKSIVDLERTFSYGVYLGISARVLTEKNIPYQFIYDDIYAWKFACDTLQNIPIHNFNMTLYRKEDILAKEIKENCTNLAELEKYWQEIMIDNRKVGLFYKKNKLSDS